MYPPRNVYFLALAIGALGACSATNELDAGQATEGGAQSLAQPEMQLLQSEQQGASAGQGLQLRQRGFDSSALCVDVRDHDNENGARLQLWSCANSDNQHFTINNGLVQVFGNKCLNVIDGKNANGVSVQIWDCNGQDRNMLWDVKDGQLRWRGTDKCLDVTNGQFKNAAPLQIWTCNPTSVNQTFVMASNAAAAVVVAQKPATTTNEAPSSDQGGSSSGTPMDLRSWQQEVHAARAFNNEQQSYTDGGKNVSFGGDGTTTLTARPTGGSNWTSARLSGPPMGPLPWYLEATIAAPTGQGSWPAFWLTARGSWPQGGEVDVMEQVNGTGQTHISTHWGAQTGNPTFNTHEAISGVDAAKPHRYGVWATDGGLQFYLDGRPIGAWVKFPAASNFGRIASEMVPIVNVAMGGDWPGNAPQSTGNQKMVVYSVTRGNKAPEK